MDHFLLFQDTPGAGTSGEIHSIELSRPVASLAASVFGSVEPLFSLHTILQQAYGENSTRLHQFLDVKQRLGREWEHLLNLLRRCMGYARNYTSLCLSLQAGDPSSNIATAGAILASSRDIRNEAKQLFSSYARLLDEFESLPHPHRSSHTQSTNPRHRNSLYNLSSVHEAFAASLSSLRKTVIALEDVATFWDEHVRLVSQFARGSVDAIDLARNGYFERQMSDWLRYHDSLRSAISDITSYCDALTVTPVKTSSRWRRLRLYFRTKISAQVSVPYIGMNRSTATLVAPDTAQEWHAGYLVLTSSKQYDVASLQRVTSKARKYFQRLSRLKFIEPVDVSPPLPSPLNKFSNSLQNLAAIAFNCSMLYHSLQKLAGADSPASLFEKLLLSTDNIRESLRLVLDEYDSLHGTMSHIIAEEEAQLQDASASRSYARRDKTLPRTAESLMHLMQSLIDLDDFLYNIMAGIEYLRIHALNPSSNKALWHIWRIEERRFLKYQNSITAGPLVTRLRARLLGIWRLLRKYANVRGL